MTGRRARPAAIVCPEPPAAEAGLAIYRLGGNAADAAVAAAFAQGVANPFLCGLGGTSVAQVYDARTRRPVVVHAGSATPQGIPPGTWVDGLVGRSETVGRYIVAGEENQTGYRAVMVPGFVRGAQALFERFGSGRVSWRQVLEPSIRLAREGFAVYPYIAGYWQSDDGGVRPGYPGLTSKLGVVPEAAATYRRAGEPYRTGDRLVQAAYGDTLERLAEAGAEDFYSGEIARQIAADFAKHGGWITLDDLRGYQVRWRDPIDTSYRGRRLTTVPPPSNANGLPLAEMLRLIETADLHAMGHNSAGYVDHFSRAMRVAFRDNARYEGDPDFVEVPVARLLADAYLAEQRALMAAGRSDDPPSDGAAFPDGTTHLTAIDGEGNVVTWTHTIGSIAGAGAFTPALGFLYNNFMGHYDPRPGGPQSIVPGKRMGAGCSTILYGETGLPILGIGAPGGSRLVSSTAQVIVNALDFGLPLPEAVACPRFHSEERRLIFLEPALGDTLRAELTALGNEAVFSDYMSRVHAIRVEPESGALELGADPRGGAGAALFEG